MLTDPGSETLVRSYHLIYQDQLGELPFNGTSLLTQIVVEGHKGASSELLPPLEFNYTEFKPEKQKFIVVKGSDLPAQSLADPSTDLVDLFGQGLLDVLEMNGTVRYWRNRGNGTFDIPRPMQYAPAGVGLADPGVQWGRGLLQGRVQITGFANASSLRRYCGISAFDTGSAMRCACRALRNLRSDTGPRSASHGPCP